MEVKGKIDMGLKSIEFGAYAMVYVGTTNNMKIRSDQEIALKASHETAELYCVTLYTGDRMHSYICYELPIYNELIRRV